jgi:hypothetical protein
MYSFKFLNFWYIPKLQFSFTIFVGLFISFSTQLYAQVNTPTMDASTPTRETVSNQGGTVLTNSGASQPDGEALQPSGETSQPNGEAVQPSGETSQPDGQTPQPSGETSQPDGQTPQPSGETSQPDGQTPQPGGETSQPDGQTPQPSGETSQPDGQTPQPSGETSQPDGQTPQPSGETSQPNGQTPQPSGDTSQPNGQTPQPSGDTSQPDGQTPQPSGETSQPDGQTPQPSGDTSQPNGQTPQPSGETSQPDGQTPQPSGETSQPDGQTPQPSGETSQPNGQTPQPSGDTSQPDGQTPQPSGDTSQPNGQTPQPNGETSQPNGQTPQPSGDTSQPNGQTPQPSGDTSQPNGQTPQPNSQTSQPNNQTPQPNGETPQPNNQTPQPNGETSQPNGQTPQPNGEASETDCDISETNNGEAKIQGEASGVGGEASQTQCKAPETKGEAYAEQIKQEMVSRGQFQTEAGAIGKEMSIHESEKIKITGSLQPAASHLEKLADIVVTYHWTSPNGKIISMPMTIARQVPLKTEMDWVLFEGYTIGLAGNFELELGYRLNAEEFYSKPIAQLNVIPNQAPTDILLDGDTVAENSPPGTVIGSFTTVDSDTGEWFFYGLVDNPGGYFTIRGNELQVANGSGLDYENSENYPITVRSVDTSGNHLDKTFIIHVTDVPTVLDNLRLTNKYVLEQSLPGTAVARLITSSRERARYQYELVDDANGRFYLQDDILLVANNQALDFETQMTHDITIRSRATEIEGQIEKTFTIELVNIIDVVVTGEIRDANNLALSTTAIPTNQPVKIMIHLTPDAEHRGQEAEIIAMALHYQDQRLVDSLALNEAQQWQFWDGNLFSLPGYQRQILPEKADLLLYQDSFSDEFAKGTLKIYVGYRLIATGELVYPQEPVMKIMIR